MHTFLALDVALIPQQTKDNIPTFWKGVFSNDGIKGTSGNWLKEPSRMLLDGYDSKRKIVHSEYVLSAWLRWETNPQETLNKILSTAIEYTKDEYKAQRLNPESIWHEAES